MSKAIATIDLNALKVAGANATGYITQISDGGIKVHDASNNSNYVAITSSGMDIYSGTTTATKVASFGASGSQIGKTNASHISITSNGLELYKTGRLPMAVFNNKYIGQYNKYGVSNFHINSKSETNAPTNIEIFKAYYDGDDIEMYLPWPHHNSTTPWFEFSFYDKDSGSSYLFDKVSIEVDDSDWSYDFFENSDGTFVLRVVLFGSELLESMQSLGVTYIGVKYDTLGEFPYLTFGNRLPTGEENIGKYSAVIGENCMASGATSMAIGESTRVLGVNGFSSGQYTCARGDNSAAFGKGNIASRSVNFAIGSYNDVSNLPTGGYPFMIGGGTSSDRKNIFTVDWNGQIQSQGISSLDDSYKEIYVKELTETIKTTYKLTSSNSDSEWLQAVLKLICNYYPSQTFVVFKGRVVPNSCGYFEVFIYDTSKLSNGIPQYACGTWRKWPDAFGIFKTNQYAFSYTAK